MKKFISILLTTSMLAGSAAMPFAAIAAETVTTASRASEAAKTGTLTVNVYNEDEGGLYTDERTSFMITGSPDQTMSYGMGGSTFLCSVKPSESNPFVLNDIDIISNTNYTIIDSGSPDYDGFNYRIDYERSDRTFKFTENLNQDLSIYMKKNYFVVNSDKSVTVATHGQDIFDNMQAVMSQTLELINSDDFKALATADRISKAKELMKSLYDEELIADYAFDEAENVMSFTYKCGTITGQLRPAVFEDEHKQLEQNETTDTAEEISYRIVKLPDKVEYKVGESISLNGIQVEVKKGNEEPIVYTYSDVAFDYQSNIPKAPSVILHSDFRSDKAGTYKVEVVGADNLSFDINVVDDSTIKDLAAFEEGETMTLDDVIELSKKGNALTLNDLAKFKGVIAGSGIFILEYDLGKGYTLMVGSMTLEKIDYARLRYSGSENFIDIRTDDVEKYLSTSAEVSNIKGDANCDGQVDLSDAVMIMQALANPNKYGLDGTAEHHLTEQGKLNGDMNGDGLTSGDALAIQRKLLGLDKTDDQSLDSSLIANKLFIYEKETALGVYDISFGDNGKYYCHQGHFDAARDWGTWNISGDTVVLTGQFGTNRFSFKDNALIYIEEGSDGFNDVKPKDGEKFNLAPERTYDVQTKSMNGVAVSIKSDLRPHMSDLSGIGILLEVNSNDYPVTLKATDGIFVKWDIEKGSGPVKTVGKEYDIGKNGYIFWNPDKLYYQDGFESEIQVIGVSGDVFIDVGKIYVSQVKGGIFEASFEKPEPSASTDNSVIAGKIFAYEKEGAGGYCTLSFNENGRFLYSPGKLSSYMSGGDWKIDGDTVSLIGMADKTIYLKITDDTLVYIAEGSDEFPYMDIKNGEKFGIYRPEISSDKFQLNSRYTEYGLGNPKVELNLIASELPEFCYVENVRLYDEDDNFIGTMSPAMDADIWSYLVDCNVTEECSKTFYTLTKIRCGQKTYLDDVRSEINVNFKVTPAP